MTLSSSVRPALKLAQSILDSLEAVLTEIRAGIRERDPRRIVRLLKEGSPLESLVEQVPLATLWVLLVARVVLVPAYYLVLSAAL